MKMINKLISKKFYFRYSRLRELEKKIFYENHSAEEWIKIYEEVRREMEIVGTKERKRFIESGAENVIEQIIEYMD